MISLRFIIIVLFLVFAELTLSLRYQLVFSLNQMHKSDPGYKPIRFILIYTNHMLLAKESKFGLKVKLHPHQSNLFQTTEMEVNMTFRTITFQRGPKTSTVSTLLSSCILCSHQYRV